MTIVMAAKDEESGKTYVCFDSCKLVGVAAIAHEDGYIKAVHLSDDIVIGLSGSARDGNILFSNPDRLRLKEDMTHEYVVNTVVPAVFELLEEHGCILRNENEYKMFGSDILIATKTQLYQIHSDGYVPMLGKFAAVGAWEAASDCFELLTGFDIPLISKLLRISDVVCKRVASVDYPIHIISTDSTVSLKFNDRTELCSYIAKLETNSIGCCE